MKPMIAKKPTLTLKPMKQLLGACILAAAPLVFGADAGSDPVGYLQEQWAIDNYELSGKDQQKSFLALIEDADKLVSSHPQDASLVIWRGIIKSTYAGVKGGLGALKYAKAAKADFEKGIELDAKALDGSAYTSLGTLYFNVPGWPIGFGDDKKAESMLKQGLAMNPQGIDANYFYGQYLRDEGRYEEARKHLQMALTAAPRAGREVADAGRRKEVQNLLHEVEQHLN